MHEYGVGFRPRHQPGVHLIALEQIVSPRAVPVAHRYPSVGDDAVGPFHRFLRIAANVDRGTRILEPVGEPFLRLELGRGGDPQAEIEALGCMHPRGEHVVAVARPGDGAAADRTAVLLESHNVGEHLAGMRTTSEAVDHRHSRVLGELQQRLVLSRADHDAIDVAREHPRRIRDTFAATELHVVPGERDRLAAELAHGNVEGDPRAGRRPIEDHGQRAAGERAFGLALALELRLHGAARLDHGAPLGLGNLREVEEMAHPMRAHPVASFWRAATCASARRSQARSMRRMPSATSSSLTISGGRSRTTLSPPATTIIFWARSSSTSSPDGTTARKPTRSPSPRTSAMTEG